MNKILKSLMVLVIALSFSINVSAFELVETPGGEIPEGKEKIGQVQVIVEDKVESDDDSVISPRGEIINDQVDLYEGDSVYNLVIRAANQNEIGTNINDTGWGFYIAGIDGLDEYERGSMSGWVFTINDWFPTLSMSQLNTETTLTSANGDLQNNDIVRIMYSLNYGSDLGSDFQGNNKNLASISFDKGKLNKEFESDVYDYELNVENGDSKLKIIPTAFNKNFQCRIYVGEKEYRYNSLIEIKEGTEIKVICGNPEWASMNNGEWGAGAENEPATTYSFKVKYPKKEVVKEEPIVKKDQVIKNDNNDEEVLPKTGNNITNILVVMMMLVVTSSTYFILRRNN